jgi:hypothetical protein
MTEYSNKDGHPVLTRVSKNMFFDDGPSKPVNIDRTLGKKPIAAFGNSDGDLQMLEWLSLGFGLRPPQPCTELRNSC